MSEPSERINVTEPAVAEAHRRLHGAPVNERDHDTGVRASEGKAAVLTDHDLVRELLADRLPGPRVAA